MTTATIFGPAYSTYTRTARLAMEEKGADYRLEEVDLLGGATSQPAHLARQPFGKVPAFEHDGKRIYETVAIIRYVDRVFPGRPLQPSDPERAARMDQVMSIVDSYAYGAFIGKVFWQRAVVPMQGGQPDVAVIEQATPIVERCLAEFARLKGEDSYLAGPDLSLADLYLAPVISHFQMTPDAEKSLQPHAGLRSWWQSMASRPSMQRTQPSFG